MENFILCKHKLDVAQDYIPKIKWDTLGEMIHQQYILLVDLLKTSSSWKNGMNREIMDDMA